MIAFQKKNIWNVIKFILGPNQKENQEKEVPKTSCSLVILIVDKTNTADEKALLHKETSFNSPNNFVNFGKTLIANQ